MSTTQTPATEAQIAYIADLAVALTITTPRDMAEAQQRRRLSDEIRLARRAARRGDADAQATVEALTVDGEPSPAIIAERTDAWYAVREARHNEAREMLARLTSLTKSEASRLIDLLK